MPKTISVVSSGKQRRKLNFRRIVLLILFLFAVYLSCWWQWSIYLSPLDDENHLQQQQQQPRRRDVNDKDTIENSARPRIVYVHVGKTGGEWVKAQLHVICKTRKNPQLKQKCLKRFTDSSPSTTHQKLPSSYVSQLTVGYIHTTSVYPRNAKELSTHYMYSIRHPYERLKSWYIYNHPRSCDPRESNSPSCKNKLSKQPIQAKTASLQSQKSWNELFFQYCFPTFYDIGYNANKTKVIKINADNEDTSSSASSTTTTTTISCSSVLWNGIKGTNISSIKQPNHLYWNYQYYWSQTMGTNENNTRKQVFVLRQESLKEDFVKLQTVLEQWQHRTIRSATTAASTSRSISSFFPADTIHYVNQGNVHEIVGLGTQSNNFDGGQEHRRIVCCELLYDEIVFYHNLIQYSMNLNSVDKEKATKDIYERCGFGVLPLSKGTIRSNVVDDTYANTNDLKGLDEYCLSYNKIQITKK